MAYPPSPTGETLTAPACPAARSNGILAALPESSAPVFEALETVYLNTGDVLVDIDQEIRHVYFLIDALVSIICLGTDGSAIEVGQVGHEGMVGLPAILGGVTPHQAVVQVGGHACRMSVDSIIDQFHSDEVLRQLLLHYINAFLSMTAQYSICNCYHTLQERLCRWLLVASDRTRSNSLPLTHDTIARLLGARRASITVTVGLLERAGLLRGKRGMLLIDDRHGLEQTACECYAILKTALEAGRPYKGL